ncbi:hypothetical protein [Terrabacter carboxydivorans]|uniref:Uncharacterized protein n=1 Tax=Terrabacter carboxydivorans TaxID=619730 RepID=A0ABN3L7A7_9MICO
MTALVLTALAALALVDGACSGFRSALGRTGLVDHAALDRRATLLGVRTVLLCLPACSVFAVDVVGAGTPVETYAVAGEVMLIVLVPYAVVVLLALGAYAVLGWRQKYVAMALVLGPFTLVRPLVAVGAAVAGAYAAPSSAVVATIALATVAVLLVEPVAGRGWAGGAGRVTAGAGF